MKALSSSPPAVLPCPGALVIKHQEVISPYSPGCMALCSRPPEPLNRAALTAHLYSAHSLPVGLSFSDLSESRLIWEQQSTSTNPKPCHSEGPKGPKNLSLHREAWSTHTNPRWCHSERSEESRPTPGSSTPTLTLTLTLTPTTRRMRSFSHNDTPYGYRNEQ